MIIAGSEKLEVTATGGLETNLLYRVDGSSKILEQYKGSLTLTASTTAVLAALTFAHASYNGLMIEYRIKEATTNDVRIGILMVATDGTTAQITDTFTETASVGVTWTAAVNGTNVELTYTTTANAKIMHADMKLFLA